MNVKNSKIIGVIVGIILFILLGMGLTYAYVTWTSPKINKNVISKCFNVLYTKGSDITGMLLPSDTYKGGLSTIIKMNIDSSCDIDGEGIIKLNTESTTSSNLYRQGLLNYAIEKDNKLIKEGYITSSGVKEISVGKLDRNTSASTIYKLYIWVDNRLVTNGDVDLTYSGNISSEVRQFNTLVQYINNLYINTPKKSTVTNNNITYHYADSVSLMNDGFDESNRVGLDEGNIRYYGATPNNYIYLPTKSGGKDKYRIIGLFKDVELVDGTKKDLVKVIRNESIGNYSWDTSATNVNSGYGINQWGNTSSYEGADLMRLLNLGHSGINGSLWWDGNSGNCYNNSNNANGACNFTSTGLNSSIQGKIESVTWHMGGGSSSIYSDAVYRMEKGDGTSASPGDGIARTSTWTGKFALMSLSDYGYAVNFGVCTGNLYEYNKGNCPTNNWLKKSFAQWLLVPYSPYASTVWFADSSGGVGYSYASYARGVRPTFYLNSELSVVSGDGSSSTPYEIK